MALLEKSSKPLVKPSKRKSSSGSPASFSTQSEVFKGEEMLASHWPWEIETKRECPAWALPHAWEPTQQLQMWVNWQVALWNYLGQLKFLQISPSAAVQWEKSAKPLVRLLPEHWILPSTAQQGISITSWMWLWPILQCLFNWDSLHARLDSHYEAWSYKKKNHRRVKAYRKSV